jgi:hypothetical protein
MSTAATGTRSAPGGHSLAGRVATITGASRGVGVAAAWRFAAARLAVVSPPATSTPCPRSPGHHG